MSIEAEIYRNTPNDLDMQPADSLNVHKGSIEIIDLFSERGINMLVSCDHDNTGGSINFLGKNKKIDALLFIDNNDREGINVDAKEGIYLREGQSVSVVFDNDKNTEIVFTHSPEETPAQQEAVSIE